MTPTMHLLISAIVAVSAFAILVIVNGPRRRCHERGSVALTRSPIVNWLRSLDRVERINYAIALVAAIAMTARLVYGLPSLESYLSFILFHVVLVSALACGFDHGTARCRKTRRRGRVGV